MTDWQREYRDLVKALWRAHCVYVSNGGGAYNRHVWPVIANARQKLKDAGLTISSKEVDDDLARPSVVYAIGCRDDLGSYGMFYGPTSSLKSCLDYEPSPDETRGRPCYILEFSGGGPDSWRGDNKIVAKWTPKGWVQRKQ